MPTLNSCLRAKPIQVMPVAVASLFEGRGLTALGATLQGKNFVGKCTKNSG